MINKMVLSCQECGTRFDAEQYIDEREETYDHSYEPYPINCPGCGSEVETNRAVGHC